MKNGLYLLNYKMEELKNCNGSSFDEFDDNNFTSGMDTCEITTEMQEDSSILESNESDLLSLDEIIQKNISKNVRNLKTFLNSNSFITEKNDQNTNIINVGEKKTYCIPPAHIEEFFTIVESCRKEQRMLHLSERQETATVAKSGIMIDFDCLQKSKDPQINELHFDSLTRHIGKLLHEFIDFSQYSTNGRFIFKIFYIRKPKIVLIPSKNPTSGQPPVYKDGFHILIPEVQISKGLKRHFLQELINRGIIKSVFKDVDYIGETSLLDKMSATNPVHFFGNSKPGKPSYLLTHVFELTMLTAEGDIDKRELDAEMINSGIIKLSRNTEPVPINLVYELSLSFYLQTFAGKPTWLRKVPVNFRIELETKIQLAIEKSTKNILSEDDIFQTENSVDILTMGNAEALHIKKLLEIIDISYATQYEKWLKVIFAIANTNVQYKPLAIWFSHRKPEAWSLAEIERVWSDATTNRYGKSLLTKRSLIYWARESSPQRYQEIEKENYFNVLARGAYENEGKIEHALAAKVCYTMIGDKFIVDIGNNDKTGKSGYCWYEFVMPGQAMRKGEIYKWRKELEPDNVHLFISEHMPKVYTQLITNIKDRKDNAQNEGELKYWATVEKNFRLSKSKLGNDQYQNGVVKQAHYRFRHRGFIDSLDMYEDVIGVGNGVLKIGKKPELIKGFHEYKISKFTETDYVEYDPENPYIKTLLGAFRDIFPEEDVFEFMMFHAATGLDAKESACILLMLVGGGQNGKTFYAKMIHNTLGNMYCAAGKSSLLTSHFERPNEANEAQMQMKDKRAFYFDEFNKCEQLNTARLKGIVNPNWQTGRCNYGRQTNFKNTCNPICLSNFDFIIEMTDHGTWRRCYYYKNKVKFCANPKPDNPYEKKVNPKFMDEYASDPLYKQAMLSIMVHYYTRLCNEYGGDLKRVKSPTIARETEDFRNRQDSLNKFITQMLVKSPNAAPIKIHQLATKYIDWYSENVKQTSQTNVDVQAQFENSRIATNLEHRNGTKFLIGYRLKYSPDEPLEDGEEELQPQYAEGDVLPVIDNQILVDDAEHDANDDTIDDYIHNLTNNVPNHIQTREMCTKSNEIDELNDCVNEILSANF